DHIVESEVAQTRTDPGEDAAVGVRDAKDAPAARALRVEDAREKALAPVFGRLDGPAGCIADPPPAVPTACRQSCDPATLSRRLREDPFVQGHALAGEVQLRSPERVLVGERKPKGMTSRKLAPTLIEVALEVP